MAFFVVGRVAGEEGLTDAEYLYTITISQQIIIKISGFSETKP